MVNVGSLIPTTSGLRTVVQVLPGQTVPPSSQVVTLPVSDANDGFPPIDYFGTPLPGQAQSAASFVQTLVMPGDAGTADSSDVDTGSTGPGTTTSPLTVITAPAPSSAADTTGNGDAASTAGGTTSASPPGQNANAPSGPTARPDVSAHAATAYQTTQQRDAGQADHYTLLIG